MPIMKPVRLQILNVSESYAGSMMLSFIPMPYRQSGTVILISKESMYILSPDRDINFMGQKERAFFMLMKTNVSNHLFLVEARKKTCGQGRKMFQVLLGLQKPCRSPSPIYR